MKEEKKIMPKWLKIVLIVLAIFIVISIVSGNGDKGSSSNSNEKKPATTETQEKFTLSDDIKAYAGDYNIGYYIEGTIKNNLDKEYSYVQVEFTTYDKDGNTLGTCVDNNSGLEANGTWKFKASCIDNVDQIASYKLKEITGW